MTDDGLTLIRESRPDAPASLAAQPLPLIWEDEPAGSNAWWLSRAQAGGLQLFIATDPLTASLLCLGRSSVRPDHYDVLAIVVERATDGRAASLEEAKQAAARKASDPMADVGRSVLTWRIDRAFRLALNQVPLALAALAVGALLGLAVGLFAVSTALVGWPMLAAGIFIGAASGPLLKLLIDRRLRSVLGPWGRFWVATLSAFTGALITAGGLLGLFWQ